MGLKGCAREALATGLRFSGLPALIRRVYARRKATIVLYHDPRPDVFARHLAFYASRYNFVSLDELVGVLRQGDWQSLPDRALVITIDDGHRRNRALLDLCREYGAHPTIYLCSQLVDTNRHFWWMHGELAGREDMAEQLKSLGAEQMDKQLLSDYGYEVNRQYQDRHTLNRGELGEMAPVFDFQSHGRLHQILIHLDDQACWREISGSRQELEGLTDAPCRHFAYPNGDFGPREKQYLARAGYLSGRTTNFGWVRPESDPFALKILGVPDDASRNWLEAYLTGIPGWARYGRLGGGWRGLKPKLQTGEGGAA